jgi:hypothetical protein
MLGTQLEGEAYSLGNRFKILKDDKREPSCQAWMIGQI